MTKKKYHSESEWLAACEPLVTKLAKKWGRHWQDEYAQELRMRVVEAYRTYDDTREMSLKNWTWLLCKDGHMQQKHLEMHYAMGKRASREQVQHADLDDDEQVLQLAADLPDPDNAKLLDAVRREVAILLAERNTAKSIGLGDMLARLAASDHGDLTEVAKSQGVSKEAVRATRARMLAALKERLEVEA